MSQKCSDGGKMYKQVRCIKVKSCCCFCLRGIWLFSVPFYPSERSARDARGEGKEKNEASTNFLLPFVHLSQFFRFAKMKPKRLIHRLLTFLILFCVSFLFSVCLFMFCFFFAVLITGDVTNANAFWEGACHCAKNNRKCWSQTLPPGKTWYVYRAGQSNWLDGSGSLNKF